MILSFYVQTKPFYYFLRLIWNAIERYPRVLQENINNVRKNENNMPTGIVNNVSQTFVLYR